MSPAAQEARRFLLGQPDSVQARDADAFDEDLLRDADEVLARVHAEYARSDDHPMRQAIYDLGQLLGAALRKAERMRRVQTE